MDCTIFRFATTASWQIYKTFCLDGRLPQNSADCVAPFNAPLPARSVLPLLFALSTFVSRSSLLQDLSRASGVLCFAALALTSSASTKILASLFTMLLL